MDQELVEEFRIVAPVDVVFEKVASVEGMTLFTGWGLLPGVKRVEASAPARAAGVRDVVFTSDGARHHEEVTAYEPPHAYGVRIFGFESPLGRLVHHMDERWEL